MFHDNGRNDIIPLKYEIFRLFHDVKSLQIIKIYHSIINRGALNFIQETNHKKLKTIRYKSVYEFKNYNIEQQNII